jgi:hypothetical protein
MQLIKNLLDRPSVIFLPLLLLMVHSPKYPKSKFARAKGDRSNKRTLRTSLHLNSARDLRFLFFMFAQS